MEPQNDNCVTCPFLAVERDARGWPKRGVAGHCKLRDFPIEELEGTWCANHPERNVIGFEVPVGPIWIEGLPAVSDGAAVEEEGAGETCGHCEGAAPGPRRVVWRKDERREVFCNRDCYLEWAKEKDPSVPGSSGPISEDVAELRRLHRGLCAAETGLKNRESEGVKALGEVLRFTERSLHRVLQVRNFLPKGEIERRWPDLLRGRPDESREHINPGVLEIQLALRELLQEPPDMVPGEPSERAFEYARVRWARMVVGELAGVKEGPETPKEADRRFRGRHRPLWREGPSSTPEGARRLFYLERNPDVEPDLRQYFAAAQSTD